MKQSKDRKHPEAVQDRHLGLAEKDMPKKKKRLLNLQDEAQHQTGKDKLQTERAVRENDRSV